MDVSCVDQQPSSGNYIALWAGLGPVWDLWNDGRDLWIMSVVDESLIESEFFLWHWSSLASIRTKMYYNHNIAYLTHTCIHTRSLQEKKEWNAY